MASQRKNNKQYYSRALNFLEWEGKGGWALVQGWALINFFCL